MAEGYYAHMCTEDFPLRRRIKANCQNARIATPVVENASRDVVSGDGDVVSGDGDVHGGDDRSNIASRNVDPEISIQDKVNEFMAMMEARLYES